MTKLRNNILDILLRIEKDEGYSNLLLNFELEGKTYSEKDRALITEIVYGTLQRKLTLDFFLDPFIQKKKKLDVWVRMLLRMSLYQMIFLDKIPDHAIIHEAVEIAKARGHKGIAGLVNGVLRNVQRKGRDHFVSLFSSITDETERLAIRTSHPYWLVRRWVNAYGFSRAQAMCEANLERKPISVRIQPLRISRDEALETLQQEGLTVRPSPFSEQGIIVEKGNIISSSLFRQNYLTVQDQSSMLVAEMLKPKPDSRVLDACSAPGGKATHIAEKMNNRGRIDAYDIHQKKVKLIEEKAAALELSIIHASKGDARNLKKMYAPESFDYILVDAPCSGLGVIRGKPEIKYKKEERDIERLQEVQLAILDGVSPLLKSNGTIIYSTCTVELKENEEVVKRFLHTHPDYALDESFRDDLPPLLKKAPGLTEYGLQLFPQDYATDGFFLTRLKKV